MRVIPKPEGRCPSCQRPSFKPVGFEFDQDGGTAATSETANSNPRPLAITEFATPVKHQTNYRPHPIDDCLEDPIREFRILLNSVGLRFALVSLLVSAAAFMAGQRASFEWKAADAEIEQLSPDDINFQWKADSAISTYERWERITQVTGVIAGIGWMIALSLGGFSLWWSCFAPKRLTDVIYLRSFRNDDTSWPIRVAIQEAIGTRHRLSGIRDPHRRETSIFEKYAILAVAMKYSTPKYMDLEARMDWQSRLWNSLAYAQAAVIDVQDMTDFVRVELQLAVRALGADRVILVAMLPNTEESVRAHVKEHWPNPLVAQLPVIIWDAMPEQNMTRTARQDFIAQFRTQFQGLLRQPNYGVRLPPPDLGGVLHYPRSDRKARKMLATFITFQIGIGLLQFAAGWLGSVLEGERTQRLLEFLSVFPIFVINTWLLIQNWVLYIRDVGIRVERIKASIGLIIFLLLLLLPLGLMVDNLWNSDGMPYPGVR